MGRCVGIPERVELTSAAASEATVTAAVASVLESPATFEATAPSSDAADWALAAAWEASAAAFDPPAGVAAMMRTGEGVYVPPGIDALAGICTDAV